MFYAIKDDHGNWVKSGGETFQQLGRVPTLYSNKPLAEMVVRDYKFISKNSGKNPRRLTIVPFGELS
ncbi:gp39 [Alphaproteobacteria phage PhiJL001]|uniref:Gp39 n=1 Tax=Alphaproteobacteria phage PhiJL001 TaxID=2681607 RepID=Q5DN66_9CAUD|nr:gp39 [Alphaproteobacteria phage PhiJL001]AAT69515.1 gp39 [Alphaproteobacteria phage PhiJL001]